MGFVRAFGERERERQPMLYLKVLNLYCPLNSIEAGLLIVRSGSTLWR